MDRIDKHSKYSQLNSSLINSITPGSNSTHPLHREQIKNLSLNYSRMNINNNDLNFRHDQHSNGHSQQNNRIHPVSINPYSPELTSISEEVRLNNNLYSDHKKQEPVNQSIFNYKSSLSNSPNSPNHSYHDQSNYHQILNNSFSNIHLSPQSASRTASNSPVSSTIQSPNIVEHRVTKNKFNFKMKKFKLAKTGKKNSTKQSKKTKSQKPNSNFLYLKLNKGVASGSLNSLHKVQLSILNTGLIAIESEKASAIIPKQPFDLSGTKYRDHVALVRKYKVLLKIEFHVASKTEPHSFRHAQRPENEIKNFNKKLLPFDYNRVVLQSLPSIPDSDYINASHIDSILKPNAYIATQGPVEETIGDFWRMIWEQKSHIIVMLTKVFDFIRTMCCQYWPIECKKPKIYGVMEVALLTEEPLADFYIRTFRIRRLTEEEINNPLSKKTDDLWRNSSIRSKDSFSNRNPALNVEDEKLTEYRRPITPSYQSMNNRGDEYRIIYQFHYKRWPIHSSPSANSLLQFRRRVRVYMKELQIEEKNLGPIVVHCSDGCGRTGSYLVIDANLEYAKEDNMYDVFNYTKRIRQQRKGLIESVDQYKFVYECLEEAHISNKTWFPVTDLSVKMKYKSIRDPETKLNEYQREYEKICKLAPKFSIGDCAGGHRIENRDKNRDVLTIPPDNHRPYLTTFQSNDSTDFINAVYIDGYTRSREYIVTEWPMLHTVPDCWSLIYDHDCNSVVVLANPEDTNTYPPFWPTEKEKKYGPIFTVECISSNHYANIKCVPKTTQLFQITCWPHRHKVPSSTNALVELMNMVERWRQRTSYGPVCVISTNGKSRAGVYCAANVAIEQVVQHREVDVFQAVKTVRRHRPFLVENMTEYKYCYDLILHYVSNYLKPETN